MNQWIIDRSFGRGFALAFSGDVDFVRRSVNFAVNYLLQKGQRIKERTQTFSVVYSDEETLRLAIYRDAYNRKMTELRKARPAKQIDFDSLPDDFDFSTISLVEEETEEMQSVAAEYAHGEVKTTMDSIVYQNFTGWQSPALDMSYAVSNPEEGKIIA